jgi:polyisoprenoid-binding protein YceI
MNNLNLTLFAFFAFAIAGLSSCATPPETSPLAAPAGDYTLDPTHTSVVWSLSHAGLSNYTARFDSVTGALTFDPQNPAQSRVDIRIDPNSVNTGLPEFDETLATSGRYFDSDNHPEIRFVSTGIKLTGNNTGLITGDLTLRGVTKPVTLETVFNGAGKSFGNPGETLGFSATTEIMRSEWGMTHLIKLANIGDKITLRIETEFNENQ